MILMRPAFLLSFAALAVGLPSIDAFGLIAPTYTSRGKNGMPLEIKQRVLRPDLYAPPSAPHSFNKSPAALRIWRDPVSDAPRLISGIFPVARIPSTAPLATYVHLAETYLSNNPALFGLKPSEIKLLPAATLLDRDVQFIQFSVFRQGIQVADAHVNFRFKRGQLVQIANYAFSEARLGEETSEQSGLADKVRSLTGTHRVAAGALMYRVSLDGEAKNYKLTKVQNFTVSTHLGSFNAQIATVSAKLFEIHDTSYHLEGSDDRESVNVSVRADVHPRWYEQPLEHLAIANLKVTTDQGPVYTPNRHEFALSLLANPHLQGLDGKFVAISPVSGNRIDKPAIKEANLWVVDAKKEGTESPWLDKNIAQWMVYYHVDAINRRAKKYVSTPWLDETLQANVNLTRTCNAHWDGSTINLYSGDERCANTGTIADVVYHEWGHGLDDRTGGINDGAFSEGYGDIVSLVMTHSNLLGIGFRVADRSPVRDLEPDKKYPDDKGEVHAEGLIIASTFWDLFKALRESYGEEQAGEILGNYAFKMIFTANTYLEVYDALLVIDDNDGNLANGTPNMCTINQVFAQHGLASKDENCTLANVDAYQISDSRGDGAIDPGEQVAVTVQASNNTNLPLENLQGVFTVDADSKVTVTQGAIAWPSIPGKESRLSTQAVEFSVDASAPCGSTFTSSLNLSSGSRQLVKKHTFTLGKNIGTGENFAAGDLPQAINDNSTTSSSVSVDGGQWANSPRIDKATVKFAINHSYLGDLSVELVAPDGSRMEIYKGSGRGRNVVYEKDLSGQFAGKVGAGLWQLRVSDRARRDQGSLEAFALVLTPALFECH